jgi:hypothetical protein
MPSLCDGESDATGTTCPQFGLLPRKRDQPSLRASANAGSPASRGVCAVPAIRACVSRSPDNWSMTRATSAPGIGPTRNSHPRPSACCVRRARIPGFSSERRHVDAEATGTYLLRLSTVRTTGVQRPLRRDGVPAGAIQLRRRGRRRSRRSPPVVGGRRRFPSLASSRSSLSPTSRNIRSTTAPRPRVISAMASTSPANPSTYAAQIEPAATSTAADPNASRREAGATPPRYRVP